MPRDVPEASGRAESKAEVFWESKTSRTDAAHPTACDPANPPPTKESASDGTTDTRRDGFSSKPNFV